MCHLGEQIIRGTEAIFTARSAPSTDWVHISAQLLILESNKFGHVCKQRRGWNWPGAVWRDSSPPWEWLLGRSSPSCMGAEGQNRQKQGQGAESSTLLFNQPA